MTQIAIVVFREILEIAIILSVLTVATKDIKGRFFWIIGGIISGVALSLVLALFTNKISESLDGMGQEIFNGSILFSASAMIAYTVIWMQKHAKSISQTLKNKSAQIKEGEKPLYFLLFIVLFSVLRESAEIVLFCYSYFVAGASSLEIILGLIVGLICGVVVGIAFYLGLLKFSGKYFFKVTSWLLIFLAASIAMQAVGFFINAGILPTLIDPIFDLSSILAQDSFVGRVLNIFFGYKDNPSATEFFVYIGMIASLFLGLKLSAKK